MAESVESEARNYRSVNRQAWTRLACQGSDSSRPCHTKDLSWARSWLDPFGWIRWEEIRQVLCLASGGGQQAPIFAHLDCRVVSADLCPEQLELDRRTAREQGLTVECVETDMLDLSALYGRDFDLVYQAISACYVPDVRALYAEVARVLRGGGFYRVEHWSPVNMQLAHDRRWTGRGYELVRPYVSGQRDIWKGGRANGQLSPECWHYIHTLTDLIGGLCDAGFRILHFSERGQEDKSAEPGSEEHVGLFVPQFLALYAQLQGQEPLP
jgi:SAM-dependent methyltransferase